MRLGMRTRDASQLRRLRSAAALALRAAALAVAVGLAAGCGEVADDATSETRGRGPLVSLYAEATRCAQAHYRGPETALYSNRPYHTREPVESALGLAFCRGERHGTSLWILEVTRTTDVLAFGHSGLGLEERGWEALPEPILVEAAGQPFDRVYSRRLTPGRYVVRQGFSRTAPIVLWDDSAVRVAP